MPHFIEDTCVGCTLCAKNCPTDAIYGESKKLFVIQENLCIDCGICGNVCPVTCIRDQLGNYVPKTKVAQKPKAVVLEEGCTGCEACLQVCPVDAIGTATPEVEDRSFGVFQVCRVEPDKCIGCELCYKVCPWDTIEMESTEKSTAAYKEGGYVSRMVTS
jgi:ferredoxin